MSFMQRVINYGVPAVVIGGLAAGVGARLLGAPAAAAALWTAAIAPALLALLASILRDLLQRRIGVDVIALLAMGGALALDQLLAGAVIAAMYVTGVALEQFAVARAQRELSLLAARAPRIAHRQRDGTVADVPVDEVAVGDHLLVRAGEVLPVDGLVLDADATLDESALTGEPVPVRRRKGEAVTSGTTNAGEAFAMAATATADASTYARIVALAQEAHAGKSRFVRMADRYALLLLPAALLLCAAAWLISGDPLRALAVLVVATPCPLILAAPVAFVSGISRAASRGVLIKGAAALEALARCTVLIFDKTGTLTVGGARVAAIEAAAGWREDDLLRYAASLEQASAHVIASTIVQAAQARGLVLSVPEAVREQRGAGLEGRVGGASVKAGSARFVFGAGNGGGNGAGNGPAWAHAAARRASWGSALSVFVTVDGVLAGAIFLSDEIRIETPRAIRALRAAGIRRVLMVTGDRADSADTIAAALDLDAVLAERLPEDKVDAVREARSHGPTVMVGDGINDAPALAAADVGVAMGARGATASAEAADVVILVDRLDRVADALAIARRTRRIAMESAAVGMGLSLLAMGFAAAGLLPPVAGALLQEVIDAIAIGNALRSAVPPGGRSARRMSETMARELQRGHRSLSTALQALRDSGAQLPAAAPARRAALVRDAAELVRTAIVPHEREDDRAVYPELDRMIGDRYTSAALSRGHREILHLARLLTAMADEITPETADDLFAYDAQRVLLSLETIVRLHSAQEDEVYDTLANA
jgi:heavy metal translocating P-type ATPase